MKLVNIILEGVKDIYFMHELMKRRFPEFNTGINVIQTSKNVKNGVKLNSKDGSTRVALKQVNGFDGIAKHSELLQSLPDFEGEFDAIVIFDADSKATKENGGCSARREYIKTELAKSKRHIQLKDDKIFLFPNNHDDGELETLMERFVSDDDGHRTFFDVCWRNYSLCVEKHGFNHTSQKSKMNEYTAAFNGEAWDYGGINKAFQDESLWNWNSQNLMPLYDFLSNVIM